MSSELSIILKASIVLVAAGFLSMAMRRASASARHVVWASALLAALAVPAASRLLPSIDLPLLPPHEVPVLTQSGPATYGPAIIIESRSAAPDVSRENPSTTESPRRTSMTMTAAWTWKTWLALAWGLGSLVVAAGWLAALWSLHRLKRESQPLLEEEWVRLLEEVRGDLAVYETVRLRIAEDAVPPMTWGIFHPVILLPSTARTWSPMRRRLVLAHELAHVKRHDGVGQILVQAACSVYWFNPAVWYAVHRLYVERERACDDAVLRLGAPAADYADHLLQIARGMNSRFALTAVAMAHPSELKSRITAILDLGSNRQRASRIAVATLLSLIGALALFVTALQVTTLAAMALPSPGAPPAAPGWALLPRAVTAPVQTQAGKLEGLVMKAGTNDPVPGAGVELIPVAGGGKPVAVAATNEGRFTFENVGAGEYRLAAAHSGFVRSEFGQRATAGSGRTITVKADQAPASVRLELVETGAISGIVRGRTGAPLENAQVQALRYTYKDGRRVLTTIRSVISNDLGEYRLFWLPPGEYLVMATLLDAVGGQRIIETMPGGGTATRMIGEAAGERILLPNDDASVPFYFPGGTDPNKAEPIVVKPGSNSSSVNFNIVALGASRVRGVVLNMPAPTGNPSEPFAPSPRIRLQPKTPSIASDSAPYGLSPIDRASGAFEIRGVLPGSYDVVAGFGSFHGRTSIQVGGGDVEGVRVSLLPDFELNAQVAVERSAVDIDLSKLQLRLDPDYTGAARRQPSGIFQWRAVQAGTSYQVTVDQMPENAYVKAIRLGDLDILSSPFRLDRTPGTPVEIVISFGGGVSGTLDGNNREAGSSALVAVIPDEPRRGRADLYKSVQSDSAGRFRLTGIAPGNYTVLAFENVEEGAWRHPDFIRRYEDRGKAIHVDEGSNSLNIQIQVIP